LTIHRSNFSRIFKFFGRSPLISPDINILVNGGHLDLSDPFTDPVLFLLYFSDILLILRPQVDFFPKASLPYLKPFRLRMPQQLDLEYVRSN
jgi:hypothetical protein